MYVFHMPLLFHQFYSKAQYFAILVVVVLVVGGRVGRLSLSVVTKSLSDVGVRCVVVALVAHIFPNLKLAGAS